MKCKLLDRRNFLSRFRKLAFLAVLCLSLGLIYAVLFYHRHVTLAVVVTIISCGAILGISFVGHARFRKLWGYVTVFCMPLGFFFAYKLANFDLSFGTLFFIVNYIIILADNVMLKEDERPSASSYFSKPMMAFLLVSVLSLFVSVAPLYGLLDLLMLALAASTYIYIRRYLSSREELLKLIKIFAVVTLYVNFHGLAEHVRQGSYNVVMSSFNPYTGPPDLPYRVEGVFKNPNSYGFYVGATSLFFGALFFYFRKKRETFWSLLSLALFALGALTLYFSYSRGAFLGYLAGLLFIMLALPTGRRKLIVWVIVLALFAGLVGYIFFGPTETRVGTIVDSTTAVAEFAQATTIEEQMNILAALARPVLWLIGYQLWLRQPLLGIGHGMTIHRIGPHLPPFLKPIHSILHHFHSIFFNTLFEKGILGLIVFFWFSLRLVGTTIGGIRHRRTFTGYLSIALGAVWMHLYVQGVVDTVYLIGSHYVEAGVFFLFVALQAYVADQVLERRSREKAEREALAARSAPGLERS